METTNCYIPNQNANCASRLPCGVCMMLGTMCPLWYGKSNITWTTKTATLNCNTGTSIEGGQSNG